jgi:phosphate:Na+ symporter
MAAPFRESEIWARYYIFFKNPLTGFAAGAILTGLVHSSLIPISILAVLAQQGLFDLQTAIPIVLGANLGTTVTALMASAVSSKSGKKSAVAHFVFKLVGTIAVMTFLPAFLKFLELLSADIAQQIVLGHILLNLGIVLAFAPLLKPFSNAIERVLPGKEDYIPLWPEYLNENCVTDNPQGALDCVRKELMKQGALAGRMAEDAMSLLTEYRQGKTKNIFYLELVVDNLRAAIIGFLCHLSKDSLSPETSSKIFAYTAIADDIERIADHCVNLSELAQQKKNGEIKFSQAANSELEEIRRLNIQSIADVKTIIEKGGKGEILAINEREEKIDIAVWDAKEKHLERFYKKLCQAEAGPVFVEMLVNLERISDHCQNIAEHVAEIEEIRKPHTRSYSPVTTI